MKAIAYGTVLPLDDPSAFFTVDLPIPDPLERELLVRVYAVSVNPVDGNVRRGFGDQQPFRRIGWDAAGVVEAVGDGVTSFAPGDRVFYCGTFDNPTHAEWNTVDERLVGHLPESVSFNDAAGLPLVFLTAWQSLFQLLGLSSEGASSGKSVLVTAGAGGVGSAAIQLASRLSGATVIATASRPESTAYARSMGADHVIDHSRPFGPQLAALAPGGVDFILSVAHTDQHLDDLAEVISPMGDIAILDGPQKSFTIFKDKSVSTHWHNVFTRAAHQHHSEIQGQILDEVGRLLAKGIVNSTVTRVLEGISPDNEREANRLVDGGRVIGKIVLAAPLG